MLSTHFLSDRSIAIRIDGFLSKPYSINSGVPQSSVISLVLFILFISNLLSSISLSIYSFSDDAYLTLSFSSNPQHLANSNVSPYHSSSSSLLAYDLTDIEVWGAGSLLETNQQKTTQAVTCYKHYQDLPPVSMNDHEF